jgi:GIY-YIG catalytic domain
VTEPFFPYLDMELFWSDLDDDSLQFRVHLKPNQQLKYLNRDSTHNNACFRAIPSGVYQRLAKLTTMTDDNEHKSLEELYPDHLHQLRKSDLVNNSTPTLAEELERYRESIQPQTRQNRKLRQQDRKRNLFFCVGYSRAWKTPIHRIIKTVKESLNLSWLRVSMSYHRFPNLREQFQRDLQQKLLEGITSLDFKSLPCNCRKDTPSDSCKYNNICRHSLVVYKVECKNTGKIYIGNTQQHLKTRMGQHSTDVRKKKLFNINSDSFASHFP